MVFFILLLTHVNTVLYTTVHTSQSHRGNDAHAASILSCIAAMLFMFPVVLGVCFIMGRGPPPPTRPDAGIE
jgi:hypothetical protein